MTKTRSRPNKIKFKCAKCGGFHPAPADPDFDALLRIANRLVKPSTRKIHSDFRMNEPGGRWSIDSEAGTMTWTRADGSSVRASYNMVGSWIEQSNSFMWGWALPHLTPATELAVKRLRAYGEEFNHIVLTTDTLEAELRDVWSLTNIAAYLADMPGTFRAKVSEAAWAFFVFSQPSRGQ